MLSSCHNPVVCVCCHHTIAQWCAFSLCCDCAGAACPRLPTTAGRPTHPDHLKARSGGAVRVAETQTGLVPHHHQRPHQVRLAGWLQRIVGCLCDCAFWKYVISFTGAGVRLCILEVYYQFRRGGHGEDMYISCSRGGEDMYIICNRGGQDMYIICNKCGEDVYQLKQRWAGYVYYLQQGWAGYIYYLQQGLG